MQSSERSAAPSAATGLSPSPSPVRWRSSAYLEALARLNRFARHPDVPILIEGESGTGKSTLARLAHQVSPRAARLFTCVALSGIDDVFVNSDLFGHTAGSFTGARASRAGLFVSASGGTIFLDEIGKASPVVQQRLLTAIEDGEVRPLGSDRMVPINVRVIAATNIPLRNLIERGEFLPDLAARLDGFVVTLPPLRERKADIPLLVSFAIQQHAGGCGYATPPDIDADLMHALQQARWPNNLRELDHTVRRLMVDASGATTLSTELCTGDLGYLVGNSRTDVLTDEMVMAALASANRNKAKAARLLGINRSTLWRHEQRIQHLPPDADNAAS